MRETAARLDQLLLSASSRYQAVNITVLTQLN